MRLPPNTDDDGTARARSGRCRRTGGSGGAGTGSGRLSGCWRPQGPRRFTISAV
ncbi:Nickel ABC transporter, periplasmic nickel-binding protein NikA (TC 3.A.1.5.3) [Azospirillum largimobile]